MNVKKEAMIQTSLLVTTIVMSSVLVSFVLDSLTIEQAKLIGAVVVVGVLIYTIYGVLLSRLQYEESLKNLSKNLDKIVG